MNCKKCNRLQAEVYELWPYRKRAEKAEQERDEVGEMAASLRSQLAEALDRATQPRPPTPDAITDEMVERARASFEKDRPGIHHFPRMIRNALTAALTEPPARPEGAEEVEAVLYDALPPARLDEDEITNLANALADHIAEEMNR